MTPLHSELDVVLADGNCVVLLKPGLRRGPSRHRLIWSGRSGMDLPMAGITKGDEIFFEVPSHKAARLHMMNLQILGTSAPLASPAVALEHLPTKRPICIPVQAQSGLAEHVPSHDALGMRSRNSCRCEFGSST
jgi:hypothetical protein